MTRILLIEDDELNRDMLSRRLRRAGMEVLLAGDARQGIDIAVTEQPDLVLMDLRLPDMSGWDAARALKADVNTRRIPLIALTAYAMEGDRQRAIEVGCDDYEVKPIEMPHLLAKIHQHLQAAACRNARPAADSTHLGDAGSLH